VTAAEVAVWCEGLARVVRGGSTLGTALRTTVPPASCSAYVDEIVFTLDRGSRLADALAGPTPSPHLDLAVTVLRACALNGGPPAEPLDRAAATLRGRAADAAERQTQSAQARLSAVVMTILPVAMLTLLLTTSSTTRAAASTPTGSVAIVLGAALNIGGWRWMRRIIAGAES
jgi:tight adherence protein B